MPNAKRSRKPIAISPPQDRSSATTNTADTLSFEDADLWIIYKAMSLYEPIKEEQRRYDLILEKLDKLTHNT